jgi:hypothetical protein
MRLGVLSNENLDPWVNWTTLGPPLLHPMAAKEDAMLVAPPPFAADRLQEWKEVLRTVHTLDTLFWMQGASRPEPPVHLASMLAGRARRSAFVVDAWKYLISKIGWLAVLQQLDPCFVAFHEGCEELKRRFPKGQFEWLPFGVDTRVFDAVPGERTIFAYWMGRRHEPLHQAMVAYCSERQLDYRYTLRSGEFTDPIDLGRTVGRSKYFFVAPPDVSDPARTGGFSPFVMRYLEGLAAGSRLVGVLPRSGEYDKLLPREAMLEVAPDGSDLAAKLDADLKNGSAWAAVDRARTLVREHHSWAKRAEQIYDRIKSGKKIDFEAFQAKYLSEF